MARQQIRFLGKCALFLVINGLLLAVALLFASGRQRDLHMENWETESNLLVQGGNHSPAHYDVAILGTSRGRVFSRDNNHQTVEQLLERSVINLSKGGGGGLMPAEVHLSYFHHRGNRADQVIYLVDPWVFFSPINNEENNFFLRDEPFELYILGKLLNGDYPMRRISAYLQMIKVNDWRTISTYAAPGLTAGTLPQFDLNKQLSARDYYRSRYAPDGFARYSRYVDIINKEVKEAGGRIIWVMLPMPIPEFPGMDQVDEKLRRAAADNSHVDYYDASSLMLDHVYYYDHMHFNTKGIAWFTSRVLKPLLEGRLPSAVTESQ